MRRALLGMGLAVGQNVVSTVWYVLYCWCDTGAVQDIEAASKDQEIISGSCVMCICGSEARGAHCMWQSC